jgi:hypothetical protein
MPMGAHIWTVRGAAEVQDGQLTVGSGVTARPLAGLYMDGYLLMASPTKAGEAMATVGGSLLAEFGVRSGGLCVGVGLSRRTGDRTEYLRDGSGFGIVESDWIHRDWGASVAAQLGTSVDLGDDRELGGRVMISRGGIRSEGRSDYLGVTVERSYARWRGGMAAFGRIGRAILKVGVEGAREDVPDLVIGAELGLQIGPTRN